MLVENRWALCFCQDSTVCWEQKILIYSDKNAWTGCAGEIVEWLNNVLYFLILEC